MIKDIDDTGPSVSGVESESTRSRIQLYIFGLLRTLLETFPIIAAAGQLKKHWDGQIGDALGTHSILNYKGR